jgi:hypothetical protein
MLGGYKKMVENWKGFQVRFQIEYLLVIPYWKPIH